MADPLSIVSILAIAATARHLTQTKYKTEDYQISNVEPTAETVYMGTEDVDPTYGQSMHMSAMPENKFKHPQFGDITPHHRWVNGQPSHAITQQIPAMMDNLTNINNNISPVPKTYVGPGIGVGPDVPAYGGYQQLYRVLPNNVNGYKLTTLPGRSGPAGDHSGGRQSVMGELTNYPAPKTAFLPNRLPSAPGRAATWAQAEHGEFIKSQIPGNRAETTTRCDQLEYGTANSVNSLRTAIKLPSRNKGDLNDNVYNYTNVPAPNIHSYKSSGYQTTPEVQNPSGALRETDKRGKQGRSGNAGRMNVRANALNQGGLLTTSRADCSRMDGRMGPASGGSSQHYIKPSYYRNNQFKGKVNDRSLTTAAEVISNNPFATQFYN